MPLRYGLKTFVAWAAVNIDQSTGIQNAGYSNAALTRRDWSSAINVVLFRVINSMNGAGKTSDMGTP